MAPPARNPDRPPHVIVRAAISDDGGTVVIRSDIRGPVGRSQDIQVKVVCRHCNNGWMAGLEAQVKPIIAALEQGAVKREVDPASAQLLALWAAKTAAMFQYNDWPTKAVTPDQLAELYRERRPPSGMEVWIARISRDPAWRMRLRHTGTALGSRRDRLSTGRHRPIALLGMTTMVIDTVLFHVSTLSDPSVPAPLAPPFPAVRLHPGGSAFV